MRTPDLTASIASITSSESMEMEQDARGRQALVAQSKGLYSVLGPYAIAEELRSGRLQAARLIRPDLVRHVTLAFRKQGKMLSAVRVVADRIQQLVRSWDDQLMEP